MRYTSIKESLGDQGLGQLTCTSMGKILRDRFGTEVISPSVRVSKAGQHLELGTPEDFHFQLRAF